MGGCSSVIKCLPSMGDAQVRVPVLQKKKTRFRIRSRAKGPVLSTVSSIHLLSHPNPRTSARQESSEHVILTSFFPRSLSPFLLHPTRNKKGWTLHFQFTLPPVRYYASSSTSALKTNEITFTTEGITGVCQQ
jgi:hypothetical protein